MRAPGWLIAWLVGLLLPAGLAAQQSATVQQKAAEPPACCMVVGVDSATSIVTARETSSGYTFRFKVSSRRLLVSLKLGDKVWADFSSRRVRLRRADNDPCCQILNPR